MDDLRPLIALKRDGGTLDADQVEAFVRAASTGSVPDVQLAAMLMAVFTRGMTTAERTAYALAMMRSGEVLAWDHIGRPTVDKHSTGGVGDKVSLVWAPLMAAVGCAVPMISGRGLGHTGGTLDKLEAIPGFRTDLSTAEMDRVVRKVGCVITGQTADLVPADRTLYALRSQTSTVPTLDHIAPSIMSKKLAEGATTLVLDVKVGSGAFMKDRDSARELAEVMIAIGRGAGRNTAARLTDMTRPLGSTVGNALEVRESLAVLRGEAHGEVRALVVELARAAITAAGLPAVDLDRALDSGAAMETFEAMVRAQGGDPQGWTKAWLRGEEGTEEDVIEAPLDGRVWGLDALEIGLAAAALGGARGPDGSAPDPGVGVTLDAAVGDVVPRGAPMLRLLHRNGRGLDEARARARRAIRIGPAAAPPPASPLLIEALGDPV